MTDPFVKILTHCVRYSKDSSTILLSALWLASGLTLKSLKDIGCSNDYKNKGRILINSNQIVE
jgi:hypothetical protein